MNRWSWFVEEEEKSQRKSRRRSFAAAKKAGRLSLLASNWSDIEKELSDHLFFAYQHHYFYLPHIQHPLSIRTKTVLSIASAVQHCTSSIASHPTDLRRRLTLPYRYAAIYVYCYRESAYRVSSFDTSCTNDRDHILRVASIVMANKDNVDSPSNLWTRRSK